MTKTRKQTIIESKNKSFPEVFMKKVVIVSIDGMRPDGFLECGSPFIREIMKKATYSLNGRTVFPSVTLPCHMSIFHSVPPERHGVTTNTYTAMVRPVNVLFAQV